MVDNQDPNLEDLSTTHDTTTQVPETPKIENSDIFSKLGLSQPNVMPFTPTGVPKAININDQITGNFQTGPNPGVKTGGNDYIDSIKNYLQDENNFEDKNKYGKIYSYGAGYKNQDFERYYDHPKFKELGFSPYRDNDTYYNSRSSWWDDFNRMRGQWLGLAASGFKSVWGDETDANQVMEKGMAIGASSRDNAGSAISNFGLNSAYTVGILAEVGLENLALVGLDIATGGAAVPLEGAEIARSAMSFGKLAKAWSGIGEVLSSLKNAETAREFWKASQLGEKAKGVANFLNPLENTFGLIRDISNSESAINKIKPLASLTRSFGEFYKDLRELNLAHSEARLEGESGANNYEKELTDKYYEENGKMATGTDAEDIHNRAQALKSSITLANDVLVYYTNKIVLDNLFRGLTPGGKSIQKALTGSGRTLERTAAKSFKLGENAFKAADKTFVQKTKDFLLKSNYSPISKAYFLGNLMEGLQENAQDVIQSSAKDYYDKIDKDPTQIGLPSILASIGAGTTQNFNERGLDTFFSGYLMGALIQPATGGLMRGYDAGKTKVQNIISNGKINTEGEKIKYQSNREKEKEAQKNTDDNIVKAANHVVNNSLIFGDYHQNLATSVKLANEQKEKARDIGDTKAELDARDEISISHLHTLAKSGNMNLIVDHVNDLLQLSDEELTKAHSIPVKQAAEVRQKLITLKERAEDYQIRYNILHSKLPNPYNPWAYDAKKNPEAFKQEMLNYQAHDMAVGDLLFAGEDYARIGERMTSIGNNLSGRTNTFSGMISFLGINAMAKASAPNLSILIDHIQRNDTIKSLKEQISILNDGSPEHKKEAKNLTEQYEILKKYNEDIDKFIKAIDNNDQDSTAISDLYTTYRKYLNLVAKEKGGHIFTDQVDEAFKQLKDYYYLEYDGGRMASTINMLSDPKYLSRYIENMAQIQRLRNERKDNNLRSALDTFHKMSATNAMLNEIFDLGVFVLPGQTDDLSRFEVVDFYDTVTKQILSTSSEKYKKAHEIVNKYAEQAGVRDTTEATTPTPELQKVASVSFIITNDMRRQLADLGYPKSEVSIMTAEDAGYIIDNQITYKKPEVDKETQDLLDEYNNIEDKNDLLAWEDSVNLSESEFFDKSTIKDMILAKEKSLALKLDYEKLNPGEVVLMKNGKILVVKSRDDKNLTLISVEDYKTNNPKASKTVIAKGEIKNQIKMMKGDFMEKAEQEPALTKSEINDSNTVIEEVKDLDANTVSRQLDIALEKAPELLDDETKNAFKDCK